MFLKQCWILILTKMKSSNVYLWCIYVEDLWFVLNLWSHCCRFTKTHVITHSYTVDCTKIRSSQINIFRRGTTTHSSSSSVLNKLKRNSLLFCFEPPSSLANKLSWRASFGLAGATWNNNRLSFFADWHDKNNVNWFFSQLKLTQMELRPWQRL